ncbi:MAG: T9SS type A sorting domain-containing protein [Crocinitomicaceae bacterium]|nr:T9SS type A sorting domain-containing protein [Crocinitomicaceae bacterium]
MKIIYPLFLFFISFNIQSQTLKFSEEFQKQKVFENVYDGESAFADVDGDNDLDLIITGSRKEHFDLAATLYINDGKGSFTEVNKTPFVGVEHSTIDFVDVDNDGDQDVFISGSMYGRRANGESYSEAIAKLYFNDGKGNFTLQENSPFKGICFGVVEFADLDGDGSQDVIISGITNRLASSNSRESTKIYMNDGSGIFTEKVNLNISVSQVSAIRIKDVDINGTEDILICTHKFEVPTQLFFNDGNANFTLASGTKFPSLYQGAMFLEDIDGDNAPDAIIIGSIGNSMSNTAVHEVWINDRNGNFEKKFDLPIDVTWGIEVAFDDIDLDSDLDILVTGLSETDKPTTNLYLNDGWGKFTRLENLPFKNYHGGDVCIEDFDGDFKKDVFFTGLTNFTKSTNPVTRLYRNLSDISVKPGIIKNDFGEGLKVYPNPTLGEFTIDLSRVYGLIEITITDLQGRLITFDKFHESQVLNLEISEPAGVYFVGIEGGDKRAMVRVAVN